MFQMMQDCLSGLQPLPVILHGFYRLQMNRIEDEWLNFKRDELNCQVFADEYDLVIAIADGLGTRAVRGQYAVKRFRFN